MELTYISLDWIHAARLIKTLAPISAYVYVDTMQETTGGYIYLHGAIAENKHRPNPWPYASEICEKEIKLKLKFSNGEEKVLTCETKAGNWEIGEYWPKEARKILNGT